jgi:predicted DNA-binding transcriptional regulator AlpA
MSPWYLNLPEEKAIMQTNPTTDRPAPFSQSLLGLLSQVAIQLGRIADHFDPPPPDIVGTPYVAAKLGCTTDWVANMARDGEIPISCVIPGTGDGKPWKFRRSRIEQWIERR